MAVSFFRIEGYKYFNSIRSECDGIYMLMSYMSILLLVVINFVITRIEDPGETVLLV